MDQGRGKDESSASETDEVNKKLYTIWTIGMAAVILFAALSVVVLGWELKYVLVFLVFISIFTVHLSTYARKKVNSPWEPSYHKIGPNGVETYEGWKETRRTRLRTRK